MRMALIGIELAGGKFAAQAADTIQPMLDLARKVRDSGSYDGSPAVRGAVVSAEKGTVMQFRCNPATVVKAAKGKAK